METRINIDEEQEQKKYGRDYLTQNKTPKWVKFISHIAFFVATVIALITAVLACIYIRTPVLGPSMQPTINNEWTQDNNFQDVVLINRVKKGERGDVIVINHSEETGSKYVIKRLVALGGEYVSVVPILDESNNPTGKYQILIIKEGETTPQVFNDGITEMTETYNRFNQLKNNPKYSFAKFGNNDYLYIEKDHIFYLGDNRNISQDCSSYGPVEASKVVGKVVLVIKHDQSVFKECFKFFTGGFANQPKL